MTVDGLSHHGRLRVAGPVENLSSETKIDALTANVGGINYLKKARASLDLETTVQSEQETLTLDRIRLAINELALGGSGSIAWGGEGIALDVKAASEQGLPVKALISAVPNAYAADFKGMKTSGSFAIEAQVKGQI